MVANSVRLSLNVGKSIASLDSVGCHPESVAVTLIKVARKSRKGASHVVIWN